MFRWLFILFVSFGQFFAINDGLEIWYGLHGFFVTILAFFIAQLPIIGTIVAMNGAVDAWEWSWLQVILLFLGLLGLVFLRTLIGVKTLQTLRLKSIWNQKT